MTKEELDSIIERRGTDSPALVGILQDVQKQEYCLPVKTLEMISEKMEVPISRLYGLATFYKSFTLKPVGRHAINVCLGTTCHVRGGPHIMNRLKHLLHVREGGTTSDKKFTLKSVRCLGCCALAPVARIDDDTYGKVNERMVPIIIKGYE
jgi:NADH:ubiquinone oxidoreductase subunit E